MFFLFLPPHTEIHMLTEKWEDSVFGLGWDLNFIFLPHPPNFIEGKNQTRSRIDYVTTRDRYVCTTWIREKSYDTNVWKLKSSRGQEHAAHETAAPV